MKALLIIPSLTDLRYLIPFSIALHKSRPDIKQYSLIERYSTKYNGLSSNENFQYVISILKQYCHWVDLEFSDNEVDLTIQVEVGTKFNTKKRIVIQHAFDCFWINDKIDKEALYLCSSKMMQDFAKDCGILNAVAMPVPVPFWDVDVVNINKNYVTIFYPDRGDIEIANKVVDFFLDLKFNVFVKQRKKHQQIQSAGKHVYDKIWYPAEGIALPSMSNLTIGFGSSAYTDLAEIGLNYINIDLHHDKSVWREFRHPVLPNYLRILNEEDLFSTIKTFLLKPSLEKIVIDTKSIDSFIKDIL